MALNKAQLRREIQKAHREKFKLRLGELKALITSAREAKRAAIKGIQLDCAANRIRAREACALRALQARQEGAAEVAARRAKLRGEKRFEVKMSAVERPRKLRSTTGERRQESDDEVRSNLPADMVRVFDRVRKHIKGGARTTRTEAFFQWAEENPAEVFELLQHDADRYLAALLAEQEQALKQIKRRGGAVPF
jgi:ABC-type nitrate/sulfonate/bicarbonate transport system substrate-binding protein